MHLNRCRTHAYGYASLIAPARYNKIRPSESTKKLSDGLFVYSAARRSDSWIRHLFVEQDTHIALADGQTSDSRIRPTRLVLSNCFYFVIPIQKNNLTSLSRLAVLFVLSAARRLVSLLFWIGIRLFFWIGITKNKAVWKHKKAFRRPVCLLSLYAVCARAFAR